MGVTPGGKDGRRRYWSAASEQARVRVEQAWARVEADYRAGKVHPWPGRITTALDMAGLYGPEVDIACLAVEPAVDEWEAGTARPSWEQLCALADLTGWRPEWFMREPVELAGPVFICQRSGPGKGLTVIEPTPRVPRYGDKATVVQLHPETLF